MSDRGKVGHDERARAEAERKRKEQSERFVRRAVEIANQQMAEAERERSRKTKAPDMLDFSMSSIITDFSKLLANRSSSFLVHVDDSVSEDGNNHNIALMATPDHREISVANSSQPTGSTSRFCHATTIETGRQAQGFGDSQFIDSSSGAIHVEAERQIIQDADSWDAFDRIMEKTLPPREWEIHEFEGFQKNQSVLLPPESSFTCFDQEEARKLLDKEERDRAKFLRSNTSAVSFSSVSGKRTPTIDVGLDPLSMTTYFQGNSSFPVDNCANESTMLNEDERWNIDDQTIHIQEPFELETEPSVLYDKTLRGDSQPSFAEDKGKRSKSIQLQPSRTLYSNSSTISRDDPYLANTNSNSAFCSVVSDWKENHNPQSQSQNMTSFFGNEIEETPKTMKNLEPKTKKLAKYLVGSGSDEMNKSGIMEHVLEMCRRKSNISSRTGETLPAPQPTSVPKILLTQTSKADCVSWAVEHQPIIHTPETEHSKPLSRQFQGPNPSARAPTMFNNEVKVTKAPDRDRRILQSNNNSTKPKPPPSSTSYKKTDRVVSFKELEQHQQQAPSRKRPHSHIPPPTSTSNNPLGPRENIKVQKPMPVPTTPSAEPEQSIVLSEPGKVTQLEENNVTNFDDFKRLLTSTKPSKSNLKQPTTTTSNSTSSQNANARKDHQHHTNSKPPSTFYIGPLVDKKVAEENLEKENILRRSVEALLLDVSKNATATASKSPPEKLVSSRLEKGPFKSKSNPPPPKSEDLPQPQQNRNHSTPIFHEPLSVQMARSMRMEMESINEGSVSIAEKKPTGSDSNASASDKSHASVSTVVTRRSEKPISSRDIAEHAKQQQTKRASEPVAKDPRHGHPLTQERKIPRPVERSRSPFLKPGPRRSMLPQNRSTTTMMDKPQKEKFDSATVAAKESETSERKSVPNIQSHATSSYGSSGNWNRKSEPNQYQQNMCSAASVAQMPAYCNPPASNGHFGQMGFPVNIHIHLPHMPNFPTMPLPYQAMGQGQAAFATIDPSSFPASASVPCNNNCQCQNHAPPK